MQGRLPAALFLGMVADARSQVQRARYEVKYINPKSQQMHPHPLFICYLIS